MEIVAIVTLMAVIVYQAVVGYQERKEARAKERDLLNRLASRTVAEYKAVAEPEQRPQLKVVSINEVLDRLEEQEKGLPVI